MATSEVELCNLAMSELGDDPITALTDASRRATLCSLLYPDTRDILLDQVLPNFAVKRAQLAQLVASPVSGYAFAYQLPSDCLRPLDTGTSGGAWKREGQTLVTDDTDVMLRYLARITDPTRFTPRFTHALVMALAARLAYPLTKTQSLAEGRLRVAQNAVAEAMVGEGREGTPDAPECTTLLDVRG